MATIDPVKRIEALLDQAEPLVRREFLAMVRAIRNERTIEELAELLSQGRIDEAGVRLHDLIVELGGEPVEGGVEVPPAKYD